MCTRRKEHCWSGKRDSSLHAGISCSGSLLDIYGRLDWRRVFFFWCSCVSQNRLKRKADALAIFVLVEDLISCTYSCRHEDHRHCFFQNFKYLPFGIDAEFFLKIAEGLVIKKESQGTPKEKPGKFAFDIVRICLCMKLIKEMRTRWVDKNTDKTRYDTKVHIFFFLAFCNTHQHLLFETMCSPEQVQTLMKSISITKKTAISKSQCTK